MHDDSSTAKYLWLRIVLCETECGSAGMSTIKKTEDSAKSHQEQRYVSVLFALDTATCSIATNNLL